MKNDLYRKLTSITLMTIMFAGGMTIAIPGELPTAVAQTTSGTLSVSATTFGGPQVVEIVIDDPDLNEVGTEATRPVPSISVDGDGDPVVMTQANTGKWYAYIADTSAYEASGLVADEDTDTYRFPIRSSYSCCGSDLAYWHRPDARV